MSKLGFQVVEEIEIACESLPCIAVLKFVSCFLLLNLQPNIILTKIQSIYFLFSFLNKAWITAMILYESLHTITIHIPCNGMKKLWKPNIHLWLYWCPNSVTNWLSCLLCGKYAWIMFLKISSPSWMMSSIVDFIL